jgi:hypothetical protein
MLVLHFNTFKPLENTKKKTKTYLAFAIDPNDTRRGLVWGGDEYSFCRNSVHVDTGTSLHVIQMNVAVLCNQIQYVVFRADLKTTTFNNKHTMSKYIRSFFTNVSIAAHKIIHF